MTDDRRDDLLRRGTAEYAALVGLVARVRAAGRLDEEFAGDARDRRVRDVLAHLHAWHLLLEGWYEEGMLDGSPAIPADGYTWRELDALNVSLRDGWAGTGVEEIERRLDASHAGLQRLVAAHSDAELFDAAAHPWTPPPSSASSASSAAGTTTGGRAPRSPRGWDSRGMRRRRRRALQTGSVDSVR